MAVKCAIRDCRKKKTTDEIIPRNRRLRELYDKKREEGKPFNGTTKIETQMLACFSSTNAPVQFSQTLLLI